MDAVAPHVQAGVTMSELVEEVEHQLRAARSRPSFPTHIFTWGEPRLDSGDATAHERSPRATPFCSTSAPSGTATAPTSAARSVRAARALRGGSASCSRRRRPAAPPPGRALAREVNAACREPIEAAGLGDGFRHRMGHGIGLDVHERLFLSVEDETPLETGMTFTDEPSILLDGRFGMRTEDVIVVGEGGARLL